MTRFAFPIELDVRPGRGATDSLHGQLREAILEGRLATGFRLPATRDLAAMIGTARATVVTAYDMLVAEGYVQTRRGDGTFVQAVRRETPPAAAARADPPRLATAAPRHDLRLGSPDVTGFPFDVWRRLESRGWRAAGRGAYDAIDPAGLASLRSAIVGHASYARAVSCSPDDVVVTAGAQQAFDLLARTLAGPATIVAVEDPGYTPMRHAFAAAGARIVGVPVDDEGIIVERIPAGSKVVCVTPSHQFPLGVTLSAARRAALLDWARRHGAHIVEDDYDCEYRYDARPLDALQTLAPALVCYVGTFSKTMFPALRIGYAVVPPALRGPMLALRMASDGGGSPAPQQALAAFIGEGHLHRHIRRMRRRYAARRDALIAGLSERLGERIAILPSTAGLHFSFALRGDADWDMIARRAGDHGVAFERCARYAVAAAPDDPRCAIGFGLIDDHHLADVIDRLSVILA